MRKVVGLFTLVLLLLSFSPSAFATSSESLNTSLLRVKIPSTKVTAELVRASCIARELYIDGTSSRSKLTQEEQIYLDSLDLVTAELKVSASMVEGVNANLTCQYAYYVKDAVITNIFRISSGKKGLETKTGTFKIHHQYNGWWESTLYPGSMLYRPKYFYKGMALHGLKAESGVHSYAASHGCIRIPKKASDFLWKYMDKNTLVRVYGKY